MIARVDAFSILPMVKALVVNLCVWYVNAYPQPGVVFIAFVVRIIDELAVFGPAACPALMRKH